MSRFFEFNQNNSGGVFDFNEAAGITHFVIIEAETPDQASARAQDIGLYFDGCAKGQDCGCCGDRWDDIYKGEEGTEVPTVYGKPVENASSFNTWMKEGKEICVHYLNGDKKWFGMAKEPLPVINQLLGD